MPVVNFDCLSSSCVIGNVAAEWSKLQNCEEILGHGFGKVRKRWVRWKGGGVLSRGRRWLMGWVKGAGSLSLGFGLGWVVDGKDADREKEKERGRGRERMSEGRRFEGRNGATCSDVALGHYSLLFPLRTYACSTPPPGRTSSERLCSFFPPSILSTRIFPTGIECLRAWSFGG